MLTIEKFYFTFKEAASHVTMSANSVDWTLEFVGAEDAPVSIAIRMRGKEEFRKLLEHIHSMGIGILGLGESTNERDRVEGREEPSQ